MGWPALLTFHETARVRQGGGARFLKTASVSACTVAEIEDLQRYLYLFADNGLSAIPDNQTLLGNDFADWLTVTL